MDTTMIKFAQQFVEAVEKMANTTEKIGNLTDKLSTKFDEEMAKCEKRRGKYFAKSGDQFKLATDVTIPVREKDLDPDKRAEDKVINAGAIVTVNVIVHHDDLMCQLVYKKPFITVSGYRLNEMLEAGILEEV